MDKPEHKKYIKDTFNTVAKGYGSHSQRFFHKSATFLPEMFKLRGDEHLLDVATGSGIAAIALAKHLPNGSVTGIDFSSGMLAEAENQVGAQKIGNTNFVQMDMETIKYADQHFDGANCSFGLFFVEDMESQLRQIKNKIKTDGKLIVCTFRKGAFQPLVEYFFTCIEKYGVERPPISWYRVDTEEKCVALFNSADLKNVHTYSRNVSYYLKDGHAWWDIIWNAGFRGLVNQIAPEQIDQFKQQHLKEINKLKTSKGIWLEIEVIFTRAILN